MLHTGLVSITFRQLSPEQIVGLVAEAGLEGIEWGGDVHVPHGDLDRAREIRTMTADAGLTAASYGSYYRVGCENDVPFDAVLETAKELGAPLVRLWSGNRGSVDADEEYRGRIARESRRLADVAAAAGIATAYEFHGGTLTDTNASAERFFREVDHDNAKSYWQPPLGEDAAYCLEGLNALLPWLSNLHVFNWNRRGGNLERLPLADGKDVWKRYLQAAASTGRQHFAMLEFVSEDAPEAFLEDAQTLKEIVRSSG